MSIEEFKYSTKKILVEKKEDISSSYKIKSYTAKLKFMEERKIPQRPIKDVLNGLFLKNRYISNKTRNSIVKIIYSQKTRILILITNSGNEIITNRDRLIRDYGWFFFVEKPKRKEKASKGKKSKKKEEQKKEITLKTEEYHFKDSIIPVKEKENMRSLYQTKEYRHYLKLMKSQKISQSSPKDVLDDFFNKDAFVPIEEKKGIKKIIYYQKEKVFVFKSLIGDEMYENLENLVKKYGWYFYITGVPVGKSELCIAIDKIEKRFNEDYFTNISLISNEGNSKDIRVTIFPIVLKPNHNCHILGLGKLNILLDCGLSPEKSQQETEEIEEEQKVQEEKESNDEGVSKGDMKYVEEYLQNLPQLILEEEGRKGNDNSTEKTDELISSDITLNPKLDAIFVSHSHWDHISGLKELIKQYPDIPILCSRITLDLFLLRDSKFLKQENHEEIEEEEYRSITKNVIYVENGTKIEFKEKDCFLSFFHAGHMPGALMMLAKVNNFKLLYTGDYTYNDITPFAGTKRFLEQISRPVDYLLIDGTSAREDFGNISDQFHSLILFLEQKAEYGDISLIGTDPSSLAISFMLTFWRYFRKLQLRRDYKKRPNIYVDMMVRKNIQVINHRYEYIYGPISRLIRDKANPFNSIKFRWFDHNSLDFLRKKNSIIISHPPDLSYGLIRNIINIVGRNPHNFVFLAGSIHESPGLELVEGAEEIEFSDTWKMPFRALLLNTFAPHIKIKLHADKNQLKEMITILEPKEVCFFHQSAKNLIEVVEYVKELGVEKVSLPKKRKLSILN
ncbi:MAG: MBL fold metallo-hydrolase [Candidatus Lokiarchaeota archaeon]|nr:MBL fold metallo-hydrolase [Candidatus Lokiarchaeota archaeon]